MLSKISNAELTKDKLAVDVQPSGTYIHCVPVGGQMMKINHKQVTESTKIFDKYSDFYTNKESFNNRTKVKVPDTEAISIDD